MWHNMNLESQGGLKILPKILLFHSPLTFMRELIETGKVKPVIDKCYPLAGVPDALRYLEEEHAQGKIVITVADNSSI